MKKNILMKKSGPILSKALAVILSVYLVFGLVCISAFATEDQDANDVRLNELAEQGGTEALPDVNEVAVSFATEHSTISINGQQLQSPSAIIKLPAETGFSFQVIPESNASIYEVKAISGSATTALSSTDGSTYYVDGSLVNDFLTISATSTPIQESQNEATPIEEATGTDSGQTDVLQNEGSQTDGSQSGDQQSNAAQNSSSDDPEALDTSEDDTVSYSVTFYYGDDVVFDTVQKVKEGQLATTPVVAPPAAEGEHFDAWYVSGQIEPYDFNLPVMSNLDLYAAFLPDVKTIVDESTNEETTQDPAPNPEQNEGTSTEESIPIVAPQVREAFTNLFDMVNTFGGSVVSDYHSVTLVVGGEATETPVRDNTLLVRPEDPVDPLGELPFHAWYQEGVTQPFDFNTPITEDITLNAVFSTQHVVKFLDYDGYDLSLMAVNDGDYLVAEDLPKPETPLGINFGYWSASPDGEAFNEAIYENITLYPVTSQTSVVIFITDGPEIDTQSSPNASFVPTKPDPNKMIRSGYTFKYWSTKAGGEAYDFVTPLEGTSYLYAVWEAAPTGYIINFWNEQPNITGDPGTNTAKYDLVYTRVISTTVPADKPLLGVAGKPLNDEYSQIINATIISNAANYSGGGDAVTNLLNYSMFGWTDADKKALSGNGDTVINVYAKRISYVFPFYLTSTHNAVSGSSTRPSFLELSDGTRYEAVDTYTVTAKLDQDISSTWPVSSGLLTPITNIFFLNWGGYYGNGAQVLSRGSIQKLMTNDFTKSARPAYKSDSLTQMGNYPLKPQYGALNTYETRYYYVEMSQAEIEAAKADGTINQAISSTLESQKNDPTTKPGAILSHNDGTKVSYYKFHSSGNLNSQSSWNPTGWPGKDIPGYITINTTALANKYQVSKYNAKQVDGGKWSSICYYMPRATYALNLVTGEGTISDANSKGFTKNNTGTGYTKVSVTFGNVIDLPSNPKKDRFTFVGWYLDEKFKEAYDPATLNTMPGNSLTLYARYEGTDIKVNYYDNDKKTIIATGSYSDGGQLSAEDLKGTEYYGVESPDSIDGKGIFRCWYYEVSPGVIGIANWGMIVNSAKGGAYDLYPDFASEDYQVIFMTQDENGNYTIINNTITFKSGTRNTLSQLGYSEKSIRTATKDGYTFIDWNKQPDGSGASFTTGSTIKDKTTTVYAQFKENMTVKGSIDNGTVGYSSQKEQTTDSTAQGLLRGSASQEMAFAVTPGYGIDSVKVLVDGVEDEGLSTEETAKVAEDRRSYTFGIIDDVQANWEVVVASSIKSDVPLRYEIKTYSAEGTPLNEVGGTVSSEEEWLNPDIGVAIGSKATSVRGYDFVGWSTADNAEMLQTDPTIQPIMPNEGWGAGVVFYANFNKRPVYTVTFEPNGGTEVPSQQVISGEYASLPQPSPTKTGNVFASWYRDKDLMEIFDFESSAIEEDITLYANWSFDPVTVTFNSNGADKGADPTTMTTGRDAALGALPQAPERDHYTFVGWTEEQAGETAFDQLTVISRDITVYAQWEIVQYTVEFETDGGTAVPSQMVNHNEKASVPHTPTVKSNSLFAGWYTDQSYEQTFDFDAPILEDTIVYAKWTPIYTVQFDTQGGSVVLPQRVVSGEKATEPTDPTRAGYEFDGWYVLADGEEATDALSGLAEGGKAFDFDMPITSDETVYARWTKSEEPTPVVPVGPTTPEPEEGTTPPGPTTPEPEDEVTPAESNTPNQNEGATPVIPSIIPDNSTQPPSGSGTGSESSSGDTASPDDQPSSGDSQNIIANNPNSTFISDGTVPLGGLSNTGAWSLLSLLIGIFSIVVDIILIGVMLLSRRKEEGDSRESKETVEREEEAEEVKSRRRRRWALIAAIVIGVFPLVLFFVLDNMALPVAWVNQWTPLILVIAIIHVLIAFFATRKKKELREEKDPGSDRSAASANA